MRTKRQMAKDDAKQLADIYAEAHNTLVRTIVNKASSITSRARAKELLVNVSSIIDKLDARTQQYIEQKIPLHYNKHAQNAVKEIKNIAGAVKFTKIHEQAVEAFVGRTQDKFAVALMATKRKAQGIVNNLLQENITRELAKATILGGSLEETTNTIIEQINKQGITGMLDKAGRELNIASYARTLAYTEIAEAGRTGVRNVALQNGFDLVIVSSHNSEHQECADWEGKVLSITGNTKGYPTLEEAKASGLLHPNCQHTYSIIDEEYITDDMHI